MILRIRDAILIVTVVAALIATGWAFYDPGRLPSPPVHRAPVTDRLTPDEEAQSFRSFTDRSPIGHSFVA